MVHPPRTTGFILPLPPHNSHLSTTATFLSPQGGCWEEPFEGTLRAVSVGKRAGVTASVKRELQASKPQVAWASGDRRIVLRRPLRRSRFL